MRKQGFSRVICLALALFLTLGVLPVKAAAGDEAVDVFKENADAIYQAAQTLSEGWQGDASQTFVDNMEQLHTWMNEMSAILETYSTALNKNRENYEEGDVRSAANFK